MGRSSRSTASAPRTPPRSSSTTCASRARACSAARTSSTSGSPGPRGTVDARAGRDERRSRRAGPRSARRRSASPAPPTSTRSSTPADRVQFGKPIIENQAIAFKLADMKTRDRRRAAAGVARRVDGRATASRSTTAEGSMSKLKAGEVALSGDRATRSRSSAATATSASTPSSAGTATRRSTRSSRAPRRSSGWSSAARSPATRSSEARGRPALPRAGRPLPRYLTSTAVQAAARRPARGTGSAPPRCCRSRSPPARRCTWSSCRRPLTPSSARAGGRSGSRPRRVSGRRGSSCRCPAVGRAAVGAGLRHVAQQLVAWAARRS